MEKKTFYLTCERTWVYDTLIFAAGILGSYTYMLCGGIFCNAQTGNIVLMGMALGTRNWGHALYYLIPISAYTLGAFISELIPDSAKHRFHIRWETILVAVEIVFAAVLGALPETTPVQVFQVSINFIASMQYNTFRRCFRSPSTLSPPCSTTRSGTLRACRWRRRSPPIMSGSSA